MQSNTQTPNTTKHWNTSVIDHSSKKMMHSKLILKRKIHFQKSSCILRIHSFHTFPEKYTPKKAHKNQWFFGRSIFPGANPASPTGHIPMSFRAAAPSGKANSAVTLSSVTFQQRNRGDRQVVEAVQMAMFFLGEMLGENVVGGVKPFSWANAIDNNLT